MALIGMRVFWGLSSIVFMLMACQKSQPFIDEIHPGFGLTHGGEKVVIKGNNIDALMPVSIYFGNQRVYMSQLHNRDTLWVTSPASDTEQVVDVRVIGNDGTEFLMHNAFRYVANADMAECVNISKQLNGKPVLERSSKREPQVSK